MKPPEFQFNVLFMPIHILTSFERKTTIDTDNKLILCFGREKCSAEFTIKYTPLTMKSTFKSGSY